MEELLYFNEIVHQVFASGQIEVPQGCNGYLAVNKGTGTVTVNGFPLLPPVAPNLSGESTGLLGNRREIYRGNNHVMNIVMPAAGGLLVLVFKFYIDNK
jgi:hypothetical protein